VPEGPATDPLSAVMSIRKIRLSDVIDGLRRASQDDRVRVLVAKVGGGRIGLARMQEIREAIAEFRASGKLTVAWAESFGEFTHGNMPYYLATAFDRIYLQPSGTLGLTGVAVEQLFLHDALAKVGIGFESAKRYEYKTAADNLTERGFTGPAREAAERGHRRTPRQDRRGGPRAARPGPVPGHRRAGRGSGRRARLPGRGLQGGPQGGGQGCDPAVRGALPAPAHAGAARPPPAESA
jgi:hypothetical protein